MRRPQGTFPNDGLQEARSFDCNLDGNFTIEYKAWLVLFSECVNSKSKHEPILVWGV